MFQKTGTQNVSKKTKTQHYHFALQNVGKGSKKKHVFTKFLNVNIFCNKMSITSKCKPCFYLTKIVLRFYKFYWLDLFSKFLFGKNLDLNF